MYNAQDFKRAQYGARPPGRGRRGAAAEGRPPRSAPAEAAEERPPRRVCWGASARPLWRVRQSAPAVKILDEGGQKDPLVLKF